MLAKVNTRIEEILFEDVASEYDARFLAAHLRGLACEFSPEFRSAVADWERDEELHYRAVLQVYLRDFDPARAVFERLAGRRPDFAPLGGLFTDEFSIAVLFAYDELCTVQAYTKNLPHYDAHDPELGERIRGIISDEGRHYAAFLRVARRRRRGARELAAVLARIRDTAGTPYAATFVLDHDDRELFDEAVHERAVRVLRRALRGGADGVELGPGRRESARSRVTAPGGAEASA